MLLRLLVETSHGHVLIRASGELDVSNSASLTQAGEDAMADGYETVLIDFSGITFMDSSGLSALVALNRHAAAHDVHVAVVALGESTRRIIDLMGLDETLNLYPSAEQALRGR
jgi:anti-anti-sigma factor